MISLNLLGLFIVANLLILFTGRTYLYKGIANTYLKGRTGPSIYDKDLFYNRTVAAGKIKTPWKRAVKFENKTSISDFESYHKSLKTSAFLIFKKDELLFEQYWNNHEESTVSNSFSAAKTVVALLIGVALEEGKIKSLDESVANYIPEFKSDDLKTITIRHLLLMASGLNWSESGNNPFSNNAESYYGKNLYKQVTGQRKIMEPGRTFVYQSGNSQLLAYILEKATGKKISNYCSEKIWSKMQMESDAYWNLDDKDGDEKAFCCLYATARDFGKLGLLILNRGNYNGQQLIPEWYIEEMTKLPKEITTQEAIPNFQYGLHIWIYQGMEWPIYYCRGILGQYIITIPDLNLVIVRLGEKRKKPYEFKSSMKTNQNLDEIKKVGHSPDFIKYVNFALEITKEEKKS